MNNEGNESSKAESDPQSKTPVDRKRGQKNFGGNVLKSLGIDLNGLEVTLSINPDDKEMIVQSLKEISDKVDYRWKVTQGIMVVAIMLSAGSQLVNWLI